MSLLIGIDGGGSTTRVLLAGSDGVVLGSGTAGGSNVFDHGVDESSATIFAALDRAFEAAGLVGGEARAARTCFAGVAGAGAAAAAHALRDRLVQRLDLDPSRCVVDRDVCNAHAGALAGSAGAVLIAGTGSVCFGRTSAVRAASAGGWGTLVDDPGSGSWFGLQGMGAVVRAADGRGSKTMLTQMLFEHLGVDSLSAMLALWRGVSIDRNKLARLAPLILAAAERGDEPARKLVEHGARELTRMVVAVRDRLAISVSDPWPVVPVGGLVETSEFFRRSVTDALNEIISGVDVRSPVMSPSGGSLLLALELDGIKPTTAMIDQIKTAVSP